MHGGNNKLEGVRTPQADWSCRHSSLVLLGYLACYKATLASVASDWLDPSGGEIEVVSHKICTDAAGAIVIKNLNCQQVIRNCEIIGALPYDRIPSNNPNISLPSIGESYLRD